MLSKVAERVYWVGRYLERIESTARILSIYDQLLFDLPRRVKLGWYNLIVINGLETSFCERYSVRDERNVVKFLLGDEDNASSVQSSLKAVRENIRTTRDVIPSETWELVNELSLYVQDNVAQGITRSRRYEFLEDIIGACQQISGLLYGNMARDEAWDMLNLGQSLERADMTTRNLDAGIAAILQVEDDEFAINSRQIIWGNVLRSLNAEQPFRRTVRSSVKGGPVVKYLLTSKSFPRSLFYCVTEMSIVSASLPMSRDVLKSAEALKSQILEYSERESFDEGFRDDLNELQLSLAELHALIGKTWFF